MVVLRSTTDCAAVNSRSNSARDTVISRFPVGAAAVVISGSWFLAGVATGLASLISFDKAVSPWIDSMKWMLAKLYTEFGAVCTAQPRHS